MTKPTDTAGRPMSFVEMAAVVTEATDRIETLLRQQADSDKRIAEAEIEARRWSNAFEEAHDKAVAGDKRIARTRAALFEPLESDASYNLQGALDDLRGQHDPNDGGVCAATVDRVIEQLEIARAALNNTAQAEEIRK